MQSPLQNKYSVMMFGMGLFCGLTIHEGNIVHNALVTVVGIAVFYITDMAVLRIGRHK